MSDIADKVQKQMADLFVAPERRRARSYRKRPCLVCGRHTKFALRIHPSCRRKVGEEEAERLVDEFFDRRPMKGRNE